MAYATKADIDEIYGPDFLTGLLDDGVDPVSAAASALSSACDEIDAYISARYSLPLASNPAALKMPAINIAVYILANRHTTLTEAIIKRYDDAIGLLKRIGDGKAGLGSSEPAVSTGEEASQNGAAFFADDRLFTRGSY